MAISVLVAHYHYELGRPSEKRSDKRAVIQEMITSRHYTFIARYTPSDEQSRQATTPDYTLTCRYRLMYRTLFWTAYLQRSG